MEQPIIRLQKNAEKTTNKMRIPQQIIDKWGNKFYMEIYKSLVNNYNDLLKNKRKCNNMH